MNTMDSVDTLKILPPLNDVHEVGGSNPLAPTRYNKNMDAKKSKPQDVDAYLASSVSEARPILIELREIIKSTIPEVEEGISWNVPIYKYHGILAGFATYKQHVSLGFGAAGLQDKERELFEKAGYKTGKGTVQIRFDQKVPAALIKQVLKRQAELNKK